MEKSIVNLIEILAFMGFGVILMIIALISVYFDAKYGSKHTDDGPPKRRETLQTRNFEETGKD